MFVAFGLCGGVRCSLAEFTITTFSHYPHQHNRKQLASKRPNA